MWPNGSLPEAQPAEERINYIGLLLISIPLVTIAGNILVILSVLRFRALQSAINFLILGLAVADLLVALFVMPYAVYVHVYRGMWHLGNLMCDIYTASDVACSTASILLLAVISFDRYRAVSRPIQYSRQSQNIKRVFAMIGAIWVISLALASPIVFGVNVRPPDANPNECRFYNAEFSIGSSFISFVIPCVLVLFVYIRIIVALKKREQAAKARRQKNLGINPGSSGLNNSSEEGDEAGRIVAGPVVNVMMMALPSMSRHMRRFERHRQAIELAGEDDDEPGEEVPVPPEPPAEALLRRCLRPGLLPATSRSLSFKEHDFGGSSTPRSSVDESLSENIHVISNDFVSELCTTQSRHSSCGDESQPTSSQTSSDGKTNGNKKKFQNLSRNYSSKHKKSLNVNSATRSASFSLRNDEAMIPSLLRSISRRSPRIFRKSQNTIAEPIVLQNPCASSSEVVSSDGRRVSANITETETISASQKEPNTTFSRSTTANSELLGSPEASQSPLTIFENPSTAIEISQDIESLSKDDQPTVTFSLTVRNMAGSPSGSHRLKGSFDRSDTQNSEGPLAVKLMTRGSVSRQSIHNKTNPDPVLHPVTRLDSAASSLGKERKDSDRSSESRGNSLKKKNNGLAVKLVKKTLRHEQSLKRKVSKAQRKEKRATKTLGVVVGVFLICWVPFFAINILNAVCILFNNEHCQVGFDLFFYCTWIGYMNSFMNPIIYTIFNTEFRRAFKSLVCGRDSARSYMLNKQVHL